MSISLSDEISITDLYKIAASSVTSSSAEWAKFLKTVSRNYTVDFANQLLIYFQKPEATAVLELKIWEEKFKINVKEDSKAIALLDHKKIGAIKYVYDISDTYKTEKSLPVPIWQMNKKYEPDIKESLRNSFDACSSSLIPLVDECINNIYIQNTDSYISDYDYNKDLELNSIDEFRTCFKNLVKASANYIVIERLYNNADIYTDVDKLCLITYFSTPELYNCVGNAVSEISEKILRTIGSKVLKKEKEKNADISEEGKISDTCCERNRNNQSRGIRDICEKETYVSSDKKESIIHEPFVIAETCKSSAGYSIQRSHERIRTDEILDDVWSDYIRRNDEENSVSGDKRSSNDVNDIYISFMEQLSLFEDSEEEKGPVLEEGVEI